MRDESHQLDTIQLDDNKNIKIPVTEKQAAKMAQFQSPDTIYMLDFSSRGYCTINFIGSIVSSLEW